MTTGQANMSFLSFIRIITWFADGFDLRATRGPDRGSSLDFQSSLPAVYTLGEQYSYVYTPGALSVFLSTPLVHSLPVCAPHAPPPLGSFTQPISVTLLLLWEMLFLFSCFYLAEVSAYIDLNLFFYNFITYLY